MKLIRFGQKGLEKPGVLIGNIRKDCSKYFQDWNREFFINGGLDKLLELLKENAHNLPTVSEEVRWGSCVSRPGMIMCIGLNYSDHAAESGMEVPQEPILFTKASNTINGPYDEVCLPKGSNKTDWEVELAIILKKDVLYLENEMEAENAIGGYCVMNDLSEREFQIERGGQWVKGKSCPGFSPLGPWLVTPDEVGDVQNLDMELFVNGQLMQNGNTSTMIFKPSFLVYYISQFMKLEAGDIITTGTPPGVGMGMNPPKYLKVDDVVDVYIKNLGLQQQKFVSFNVLKGNV